MATRSEKIKHKWDKLSQEEKDALMNDLGGTSGGSSKKEKKVKKVRDPNKPKKNMTGYLYYAQERRSGAKSENPELRPRDLVKVMGNEWNSMDTDSKAPYEAKAATAKRRYKDEMDAYKASE
jgi:hypothetical protein